MENLTQIDIDWDDNTSVSEYSGWMALGLEQGLRDGDAYGPQEERFWRCAAYYSRPEGLPKPARLAHWDGYQMGVRIGVEARRCAV